MTSNYYVATSQFQPARTVLFGLLAGRTFVIDSVGIHIMEIGGSADIMPSQTQHYYVEVGTHPID